jgi:AhpD family alkylhydroperoxidase
MTTYIEKHDLRRLAELQRLAPTEFAPWEALQHIVEREDGAIPLKYRELLAIAVALTTQCAYCLDVHTNGAKAAGATREELAETVFITAALRAGAAGTHGALALKLFDDAPSPKAVTAG